jgi:hypothetical protein
VAFLSLSKGSISSNRSSGFATLFLPVALAVLAASELSSNSISAGSKP